MTGRVSVESARNIAKRHAATHSIVVIINERGEISGASYGVTRKECSEAGRALDRIIDGFADIAPEICAGANP